jgi:hypothetical protein
MARLKAEWTIVAMIGIAYAIVFAQFAPALLQDYPDHLARAVVVGDLVFHQGLKFGAVFQFRFMAVPYILNDLLLAGAAEVLGVKNAAIVWQVFVLLSLPAALLLYARATDVRREGQALAFLLGLYLSTSTFYLRGFLAFELAIAAILVLLALARTLCRRWSYTFYGCYVVAIVLGYLVHLSALVLLAPALAVSTMTMIGRRRINPIHGLLLLLPLGVLFAWHFCMASGPRRAGDVVSSAYYWGSLLSKAQGTFWPFLRFSRRTDLLMLLAFIVCCVWPYRTREARQQALADPRAREMGALALTYLGVYIVLPLSLSDASWVDVRAIPLVALFLLMGSLVAAAPGTPSNRTLADAVPPLLAAVLAVANLIYLDLHLSEFDGWLARYRNIVSAVPAGAYVLPIYTNKRDRPIKSTLHAASFTAIDRAAFTPYFFSGDQGEPMRYFRYNRRPYAPEETWYVEPTSAGVEWNRVACAYGFLLVMQPYDPGRISIATRPVVENDTAALEAIAPGACAAQGVDITGSKVRSAPPLQEGGSSAGSNTLF